MMRIWKLKFVKPTSVGDMVRVKVAAVVFDVDCLRGGSADG